MSLAIVFPGQGARPLASARPGATTPPGRWSTRPSAPPADRSPTSCSTPTAEELADTRNSQLVGAARLAAGVAGARADARPAGRGDGRPLARPDHRPHRLGHGAVRRRASGSPWPAPMPRPPPSRRSRGGLVVLLGADEDLAVEACDAAPGRAWLANVNAPGQVVVGGDADALDAVVARAKELGVRRATRLAGRRRLPHARCWPAPPTRSARCSTPPRSAPPPCPSSPTTTAPVVTDAADWPERLRTHLVRPVRWTDTRPARCAAWAPTRSSRSAPAPRSPGWPGASPPTLRSGQRRRPRRPARARRRRPGSPIR